MTTPSDLVFDDIENGHSNLNTECAALGSSAEELREPVAKRGRRRRGKPRLSMPHKRRRTHALEPAVQLVSTSGSCVAELNCDMEAYETDILTVELEEFCPELAARQSCGFPPAGKYAGTRPEWFYGPKPPLLYKL